ncbi:MULTISPECIES: alpha-amylase family glycosyl hydrolase [unclassified Mesobacillus]|uniref:alpha-amylase family glycosyl hydrolase n=1 Tax=unclassified Mesobacillus TaxID=2675270 RepID=UPI00203AA9CB|nr:MULTISPECIES: alpha-amylase family glycosyl hydrolase [unclassified Mesobacillus]MCM3124905.1 alpha-amylase family glycosyl hydrolase [Mesobacillus sp. MER 33]MCM3232786.1 alpha-amylase family glycosyl hydrolase [Mesobacillus sp. MER 48]
MKKKFIFILIPFLLFYALPVGAVEKEGRKWQDETIYFLIVDRFNNGDNSNDFKVDAKDPKAYHGGDFQGVIDELDYIKDMGFTAIWLTPVFDNVDKGYHGYWIKDFYNTEEHFGSVDKFKELVKEAHKRDIKIILDFVVNHVAPEHEWVNDPAKQDWFHEKQDIIDWNNQDELENNWLYGLPDLAQENPETRKYLLDAAKWWIEETDIDGYRLDTVRHVPVDFWEDFSKEVKSVKDDFYLIGEVWSEDPNYIAKYDKAGIDGFVDFPLNEQLRTAFEKPDQTLDWLLTTAKRNKAIYENPELMGNFIDNHDMVRFTRKAVQNRQHPGTRWKMALTYMYTAPGIPIVYYGSEIALDGGEDPDNRRQMSFRADKELIDYVTKIGELRNDLPSLRRGDLEVLYEKKGMAVFKRTYKDETAVIAINNTSNTQQVTLTADQLEDDKELRGLLANDLVRSKDGEYNLALEREKAEIYVLAEKTGLNIPYIAAMGAVYAAFFGFIILLVRKARKRNKE